jgi:hypothetical protein
LLLGAVNVKVALALPGAAEIEVGTPGAVIGAAGVIGFDAVEEALFPYAFIDTTVNV